MTTLRTPTALTLSLFYLREMAEVVVAAAIEVAAVVIMPA